MGSPWAAERKKVGREKVNETTRWFHLSGSFERWTTRKVTMWFYVT